MKKTNVVIMGIIIILSLSFILCKNNKELNTENKTKFNTKNHKQLVNKISSWRTKGGFCVTASEIRFVYDGRSIIIPIYGATEEPVDFGNVNDYESDWEKGTEKIDVGDLNSPEAVINYLRIKKPKDVKSRDFLKSVLMFYKDKGFIEDIDKPSEYGCESAGCLIFYNFYKFKSDGHIIIIFGPDHVKGDKKISELYFSEKEPDVDIQFDFTKKNIPRE